MVCNIFDAGDDAHPRRFPRPDGVSCARKAAFGAETPSNRFRCAPSDGTSADDRRHSQAMWQAKYSRRTILTFSPSFCPTLKR